MAFTQNTTPTFVKQPQNGKVQISNGSGTSNVTIYTAGASGSKITGLTAVSTDTVAHDVQVGITNGATTYPLFTVSVPIGAGNTSAATNLNMMGPSLVNGFPIDSDGNPYFFLVSGDTLVAFAAVAVTAGKLITLVAVAGDF